LRAGKSPELSKLYISSSRKTPFDTRVKLSIKMPSSLICLEYAGVDPGTVPPISA